MINRVINKIKRNYYYKKRYYSQYGQDYVVLNMMNNKADGFFVDIGANDGITFSNTKKMEEMGWKGICIEPDPDVFIKLQQNRKCCCLNYAISDCDGTQSFTQITGASQMLSGLSDEYNDEHLSRIKRELDENGGTISEIQVECRTFDSIMEKYGNEGTERIDFLSIDTEGAELKILQNIDFKKWNIDVISIENNYGDDSIEHYLNKMGFELRVNCVDDIYVKKS